MGQVGDSLQKNEPPSRQVGPRPELATARQDAFTWLDLPSGCDLEHTALLEDESGLPRAGERRWVAPNSKLARIDS